MARVARVAVKGNRALSTLESAARERVGHCFSDGSIASRGIDGNIEA
jgi:hypothetical protein